MKKIRKNKQISLINPKGAGRKPTMDPGIRHTKRLTFHRTTALHLTIKINKENSGLKTIEIAKKIKASFKKLYSNSVNLVHFTIEYDHIHLLVEAKSHLHLGKAMQSFGISLAKKLNYHRKKVGTVYKHRYHQRILKTKTEIKNVINYIFQNGKKHGTNFSKFSQFNSYIHFFSGSLPKSSLLLHQLKNEYLTLLRPPNLYLVNEALKLIY